MKDRARRLLVVVTAMLALPAMASDDDVSMTLGFVEWVALQDSNVRLKARLDTGAKTSSLHAVDIEPFKKDGNEWVRFRLPLEAHKEPEDADLAETTLTFEQPVYRTVLIKRKGAESQRRYVVKMDFCIAGEIHETQFSLTDRGDFSYPALLGRRFLEGGVLVDSSASFLADGDCQYRTLSELAEDA